MMVSSLPSILLVYISLFLLVELIKMGFIRARREGKRLDGGMVAGERRPRIIKYNKEIHIMIIVPCNLMLEVTGKQCNTRVQFVLSSISSSV